MKNVKFLLTAKQAEILRPIFIEAYAAKRHGIIMGQFYGTEETGEEFFAEVSFIDNNKALRIQEITGANPGQEVDSIHTVLTDIE